MNKIELDGFEDYADNDRCRYHSAHKHSSLITRAQAATTAAIVAVALAGFVYAQKCIENSIVRGWNDQIEEITVTKRDAGYSEALKHAEALQGSISDARRYGIVDESTCDLVRSNLTERLKVDSYVQDPDEVAFSNTMSKIKEYSPKVFKSYSKKATLK